MSDTPASPSGKRWYVVHAYSGMEKSVQRALQERIERAGMQDQFGQILVPTEEVVEVKGGHKSVTERRFFPGYVLVEMEMTDETWHLVKNTAKVTGFVGGARIGLARFPRGKSRRSCRRCRKASKSRGRRRLFEVGEMVRVKDGPFTEFNGNVEEVNYEKSQGPRFRDDLRPLNTGRTGVRPGRKAVDLNSARRSSWPFAQFALTVRVMAVEERQ